MANHNKTRYTGLLAEPIVVPDSLSPSSELTHINEELDKRIQQLCILKQTNPPKDEALRSLLIELAQGSNIPGFKIQKPKKAGARPGRPKSRQLTPSMLRLLFMVTELRINKGMKIPSAIRDVAKDSEQPNAWMDFSKKVNKREIPEHLEHQDHVCDSYSASTLEKEYRTFINDPHNADFMDKIRKLKFMTTDDIDNFLLDEQERINRLPFDMSLVRSTW